MAAVTLKTIATNLAANAAAVGSSGSLTTANITALAALVQLLADRPGDSLPLMQLLSDTNSAQLYHIG